MFDIGWSELLVLAAVAIIFVGPKDLPRMMRTVGQYVSKARAMARDFQNSFEDLARETELEELRNEVSELRTQAVAPIRSLQQEMNKPVKIGGAGTVAAPARAEDEQKAALDTSDLSPVMAEAVREAEAVEAYGASNPANDAEAKRNGE